jgi:hypothetical protein
MNESTGLPLSTSTTLSALRWTPLPLDAGDADAYLLAEALLGRRRSERYERPPTGDGPSQALRVAWARLIPIGLLQFIVDGGGERADSVVRGEGERRRLIEVALSADDLDDLEEFDDLDAPDDVDGAEDGDGDGNTAQQANVFSLRTRAFPEAIWNLATVILPLFERQRDGGVAGFSGLGRTDRARLRGEIVPPARTVGDHLAYAAASHHLHRLALQPAFEAFVARHLAAASPLSRLWLTDNHDLPAVDVDSLVRPPLSRCLELLAPRLATVLTQSIRRVVLQSPDRTELEQRMRALVSTMRRLVAAINAAQRTDLLAIVVGAVANIADAIPTETRGRLLRLPDVVTMADRDRTVAAVAEVFDVVSDVDAVAAEVAAARYGDDRAIEARLLPGVMAPLSARRDDVEGARRALLASVG